MKKKKIIKAQLGRIIKDNLSPQQRMQLDAYKKTVVDERSNKESERMDQEQKDFYRKRMQEYQAQPKYRSERGPYAEDAMEEHRIVLEFIAKAYEDTPPWTHFIVVGHHTPSHSSCHPRYKGEHLMNGGYHSDLSNFILDRPRIKLWTHGHTHELYDYMIGSTRIVCNPRGYIGHESIADKFELKVVGI